MSLPTQYTALFQFDDLLVQGQDYTIRCPLYLAGQLVTPTGGTVTIYDDAHRAVVDAAPVTITDGVATYTIPAATTAPLPRRDGWLVEWALEVDGEPIPPIRNTAALVKSHLYPVVTDEVIWRRYPALDPRKDDGISSRESWQDQIDEAWVEILGRLAAKGDRPNQILSPAALREVHLLGTVTLIFEDLATRLNDAYQEQADRYRELYEQAWTSLKIDYDALDNGEHRQQRKPGLRSVWMGARR